MPESKQSIKRTYVVINNFGNRKTTHMAGEELKLTHEEAKEITATGKRIDKELIKLKSDG